MDLSTSKLVYDGLTDGSLWHRNCTCLTCGTIFMVTSKQYRTENRLMDCKTCHKIIEVDY